MQIDDPWGHVCVTLLKRKCIFENNFEEGFLDGFALQQKGDIHKKRKDENFSVPLAQKIVTQICPK